MRLLFKQRLFSWFDGYDIYDEWGNVAFSVKGKLAWGHKMVVYDASGYEVGTVVQKVLTFLPRFEIYAGDGRFVGSISKEFSFLTPRYNIDYNGWYIEGSFMEWNYNIVDAEGYDVARIRKELFHMTDTYIIDVVDPQDAVSALMFVLAIDAEKCSRNNG